MSAAGYCGDNVDAGLLVYRRVKAVQGLDVFAVDKDVDGLQQRAVGGAHLQLEPGISVIDTVDQLPNVRARDLDVFQSCRELSQRNRYVHSNGQIRTRLEENRIWRTPRPPKLYNTI